MGYGANCPSSIEALAILRKTGAILSVMNIEGLLENILERQPEEIQKDIRRRIASKVKNMQKILDDIDKISEGK